MSEIINYGGPLVVALVGLLAMLFIILLVKNSKKTNDDSAE